MAFFKDFFGSKPGGTTIGNLVRDFANYASGGVLGNGANMISEKEYDKKHLTDDDYIAKYAETKTGNQTGGTKNPNIRAIGLPDPNKPTAKQTTLKALAKRYWWLLVLPLGTIIFLAIAAFSKRKRKYKY